MSAAGRPAFSVVIDSFNYARFIGQAIRSVLDQGAPPADLELIVVDDGSTDDTVAVVKAFGDAVRLIVQKNAGQAAAFATGFAAARGELVCLLDSDDYWAPGKLAAVAEAFQDPAVALAQNLQRDVDVEGRPLRNPLPAWPPRYTAEDLVAGRFVNAATSSIAVRKSVLDRILPVHPGLFYLHDDWLLMHGVLHGDVVNIPRILGCHRMHGANNSAVLGHPGRLERFIREKELFWPLLDEKLKSRGLERSERWRAVEDLDQGRRRLLLAAHQGRRADALREWRALPRAGGLGLFRRATLLLAVFSPSLYLSLYRLYGESAWMSKLRRAVLP